MSFLTAMRYKQKILKAFTLIEMLIVITIIGILAAALIPKLQGVQARARDMKRKVDITAIANGLAVYKSDAGTYPLTGGFVSELPLANYMTSVPADTYFSSEYAFSLGLYVGSTTGVAYGYVPLSSNNVANAGMALLSRVELKDTSNRMFVPGRAGQLGPNYAYIWYGNNVTTSYSSATANAPSIANIEELIPNICSKIYIGSNFDIPFRGTGSEVGLCSAPQAVINNPSGYYDGVNYKGGMRRYIYVQ